MHGISRGLRERGHGVLIVGKPGSLWTERLRADGFDVRTAAMKRDFALGDARAVAAWMRREGAEAVLTKLHRGIRFGGLAALFAGRVPVVACMGLVEVKRGWRYRLTYRLFLDWILTLTPGMRREILAVGGFPGDRVVAIPHGIVPGDFATDPEAAARVRAELGIGREERLLLAAGRLHEQKRFDLLLEAFRTVAARRPGVRLVILGVGGLLGDLQARARVLGVADRVAFPGFRDDLPAVHAASDLFVLSSDDEGLPTVVMQAMASGKAVVATDVGSVRDLVEDGVTGLVVPRRDPAALAAAVEALLADDTRRRGMGEAGRARVREAFPLDRSILRTEEFLLRVAGRTA